MTDDGTTPLARSRSSSPCSPPAERRWRCGRASTPRAPPGGRDFAMPAWLLPAVACGSLLAVSATAGAQEPPPRAALEALAGVAHPRSAPARSGAGELERALAAEDWPRAEQLLAEAIERSPRSAALLKQIAGVFLADRRPLNAAIALKKAEALAPLDPESRFRLVLAYVAMGQREWARPELERLVAAAPDTAMYRYWLGRLDYDAGQYAAAVAHLQAAASRDPSFPRTFDNLGLCYEALNQIDLAIAQYREAVRLNRLVARSVAVARHQPRERAGARRRLRGGRGAAARGGPHRSGDGAGAIPSRHGAGTDEPAGGGDRGAACRRRWRCRLRRPALRAGANLPAAGAHRRRRCRAGRFHDAPAGADARRGRSGVQAVTDARLLVAAVAILTLAAPAHPAGQAGPALAPRPVLDAITAALGRDDVAAAKTAVDPAIAAFPAGSRRPQPRRCDRRPARRVAGRPGSLRGGHPPAAASAGGLRQPRDGCCRSAPAPIPRRDRPRSAVYARLLAIDPQHAEALFQTAALEVLDGRYEAARQAIDRLPEAARGRPPVLAVRAAPWPAVATRMAPGARSPRLPPIRSWPARTSTRCCRRSPGCRSTARSRLLLELLDRRGWATPATLRRLAAIEIANGRYVEARAWLEKAAARGVPDAALLIELARAAFKAGDPKGCARLPGPRA